MTPKFKNKLTSSVSKPQNRNVPKIQRRYFKNGELSEIVNILTYFFTERCDDRIHDMAKIMLLISVAFSEVENVRKERKSQKNK